MVLSDRLDSFRGVETIINSDSIYRRDTICPIVSLDDQETFNLQDSLIQHVAFGHIGSHRESDTFRWFGSVALIVTIVRIDSIDRFVSIGMDASFNRAGTFHSIDSFRECGTVYVDDSFDFSVTILNGDSLL